MKTELTQLINNSQLKRIKATEIMNEIAAGNINEAQLSTFLSVFLMRGLSLNEMQGFIDSIKSLALKIDIPFKTCDIVGTGGDNKNTFNISTISAIIAAGAGVKVTKHGNYGVSSISGSSNVLEFLGYQFPKDEKTILNQLDENNIAFIHAPYFHPSLKAAAQTRKNLGLRSLFNLVGPLVNPCNPHYRVLGVYNLETFRLYQYILQDDNRPFKLIYNLDGYDEISLTDTFKLADLNGESFINPTQIGFTNISPEKLLVGDSIEDAAIIFKQIITNKGTEEQENACIANAALAIELFYNTSYDNAKLMATESLKSGAASNVLTKILKK